MPKPFHKDISNTFLLMIKMEDKFVQSSYLNTHSSLTYLTYNNQTIYGKVRKKSNSENTVILNSILKRPRVSYKSRITRHIGVSSGCYKICSIQSTFTQVRPHCNIHTAAESHISTHLSLLSVITSNCNKGKTYCLWSWTTYIIILYICILSHIVITLSLSFSVFVRPVKV
jgi:hypothetical protein